MNKITLIGRITKDLELKHIGEKNTANVKFNLAVDNYENGQKGADFIPVTVWGKQAENLCKYCGKGSQQSPVLQNRIFFCPQKNLSD